MKCMKCGVSISSGQVFCNVCLEDMEKHPVAAGTPVILPRTEKQIATKRGHKRVRKPEESISILRRVILWLMLVIVLLSLALTFAVWSLFRLDRTEEPGNMPGQNYGTSSELQ